MINDRRGTLERINDACEQFEEQLKQGQPVDIAEWIKVVSRDNRGELFFELLSLETFYRPEAAVITDYFERFPDYSNEIVRVFSANLSRKQQESNSGISLQDIDPLEAGDHFDRFEIMR